jgi:AcrR family transcriptional regulator
MTDEATTAERVEAAALRLFATRGFEATGIRQIAEEAGISVASLYHYMGTKEDLLDRLMRESMRRLLDPARELMESTGDPVERVAGLVELHVRKHARDNLMCLVGDTEIRSLSPARRREMVALRDAYQGMWEEAVADGAAQGRFRVPDVKIAVFALLEMCTGVAHWYAPGGRLSLDEISKTFVGMALSLLAGGEPSRIGPPADSPPR